MSTALRDVAAALASVPQRALLALVWCYRMLLRPWLGTNCRFEPSCSAYATEALTRHGALTGSYLTASRLLRCHPWCEGGCDPVPEAPPKLFSKFSSSP